MKSLSPISASRVRAIFKRTTHPAMWDTLFLFSFDSRFQSIPHYHENIKYFRSSLYFNRKYTLNTILLLYKELYSIIINDKYLDVKCEMFSRATQKRCLHNYRNLFFLEKKKKLPQYFDTAAVKIIILFSILQTMKLFYINELNDTHVYNSDSYFILLTFVWLKL